MAGVLATEPDFVLTDRDFARVRRLIYDYAGIKLSEHKRNMVYNRLVRRVRSHGQVAFAPYLDLVQSEGSTEREAFVNALTTNLTSFFREPHHFELLAARAGQHAKAASRPMRIWSSGCSTGEEPWSIAMVMREAGCAADILATDIDSEVLSVAQAGVYRAERIESMRQDRVRRHFLRGIGANEGLVSVRPELRTMLRFAQLNLQAPAWPVREPFDAIFCRNVVIYFDREVQLRLAARFAAMLAPGGLLVIGHSESFPAGHPAFRTCGRTAYELRPG
ncbi:MAG TPA: CheR family methyltransferase [Ramlibacter sp.]|nr:CheR family methyltransferase [Ramlibacter sp.]